MAECANNRTEMASVPFLSRLNDQQHDKVSLKLYFREGAQILQRYKVLHLPTPNSSNPEGDKRQTSAAGNDAICPGTRRG